jgi:hypothetical protein
MRRLAIAALLTTTAAQADITEDQLEDDRFVGPTEDQVELLEVRESALVGASGPFTVKVRNHSEYYLDRVSVRCEVTDQRGFRVFEEIVFKSASLFAIRLQLPPITTPEMGIPPGAVAEIALDTSNRRWMRGYGQYRYDCEIYGVSGND